MSCTWPARRRRLLIIVGLLRGIDVGDAGDADFDGKFDGIGLQLMNDEIGAGNFGWRGRFASGSTISGVTSLSLNWMRTCE